MIATAEGVVGCVTGVSLAAWAFLTVRAELRAIREAEAKVARETAERQASELARTLNSGIERDKVFPPGDPPPAHVVRGIFERPIPAETRERLRSDLRLVLGRDTAFYRPSNDRAPVAEPRLVVRPPALPRESQPEVTIPRDRSEFPAVAPVDVEDEGDDSA